jgi:hypothetical protein
MVAAMTWNAGMSALHFVGLHWARVWNTHDGPGMAALFHDHGSYTDPFAGTIPTSKIPTMIARIAEIFPDFRFDLAGPVVDATVKERRTLALQWRMAGTHVRTGHVIDLPGVDFLAFDGPLIAKADTYFDFITLKAQSGASDDELRFET